MLHLENTVDTKVNDLKKRNTKVDNLEKTAEKQVKINGLQRQLPEPVRVVSESTDIIKSPCFDGRSPFKLQFGTVADRNG